MTQKELFLNKQMEVLGENKLSANQIKAAAFLASGMSETEVAKKVDMSVTTICAWMKKEHFKKLHDLMVLERLRYVKGTMLTTMLKHAKDKSNSWLSYSAARDLFNKALDMDKGADTTVTVNITGAPELGMPPKDLDVIPDEDEEEDEEDEDLDE